jgi:uncharacterized membrane protein
MTWNHLHRAKSYIRSSLWFVPFIAIPLEMVAIRLVRWLDGWLGWSLLNLGAAESQAILAAVVTANLSFVVFTFGSLLVAIQIASGQLTPRIIATTLLRDQVIRYTVGLFIFTLLFSLSTQGHAAKAVPQLAVFLSALFGICSFAAFFYLIDYASRLLRPVSILAHVADDGIAVIESVYPGPSLGQEVSERDRDRLGAPDRLMTHEKRSAIVLAVDLKALLIAAQRFNSVIEFVPQVGDFVAVDEPLFNLYGDVRGIDEAMVRATVAFGSERTMEQDPTFAFRIVVDIAIKALSAAINDPTTAVLAIDQLHRMLRTVGKRNLRTDEILDGAKRLRVICRTPNWEDFVHLAFSEIRAYGSSNLQIVRRLRAMIDNLMLTLPEHRHAALRQQLSLLDREIARHFLYPEELALARVADSQGLGGHSGKARVDL